MNLTGESPMNFSETIRRTKRRLRGQIGDPESALRHVEDLLRFEVTSDAATDGVWSPGRSWRSEGGIRWKT